MDGSLFSLSTHMSLPDFSPQQPQPKEVLQLRLSGLFRLFLPPGCGVGKLDSFLNPILKLVTCYIMAVSKLTTSTASILVIFVLITTGQTARGTIIGNNTDVPVFSDTLRIRMSPIVHNACIKIIFVH